MIGEIDKIKSIGGGGVDCLKITEDKSSESRVYTPAVRLIITTRAISKRRT